MTDPEPLMTRALVLGGGGLAGIAWELGIFAGLADAGVDVTAADLVVGTSAGSVVGAQIMSGATIGALFDQQLVPAEQTKERAVDFDMEKLAEIFGALVGATGDNRTAALAAVGAKALTAKTISETDRLEIIASRLASHEWPARRFLATAVDVHTGEFRAFDSSSGVRLLDAIAASCAVPGVWPPVTIGSTRYMDGGVRSGTNSDLAVGHARVLILAPLPGAIGPSLDDEVAALEAGASAVYVIRADEPSTRAISTNPLDPATRAPSAVAGRAQGMAVADAVRAFWG